MISADEVERDAGRQGRITAISLAHAIEQLELGPLEIVVKCPTVMVDIQLLQLISQRSVGLTHQRGIFDQMQALRHQLGASITDIAVHEQIESNAFLQPLQHSEYLNMFLMAIFAPR